MYDNQNATRPVPAAEHVTEHVTEHTAAARSNDADATNPYTVPLLVAAFAVLWFMIGGVSMLDGFFVVGAVVLLAAVLRLGALLEDQMPANASATGRAAKARARLFAATRSVYDAASSGTRPSIHRTSLAH